MSRFVAGMCSVLVLCGAVHAQGLTFTDITSPAGVTSTVSFGNQYTGSACVGDFDRDGDQDLFVPMGPTIADRLFLNAGAGTFTDVAAAWGVNAVHIGAATAVGDYDDDGWLDIYLLSLGAMPGSPGKHRLYHNLGGTAFEQVASAAGVAFTSQVLPSGYGECFGDYDMDGDLNIVATAWLPLANGNRILRNNGNGPFSNVTSIAVGTALPTVRGFT